MSLSILFYLVMLCIVVCGMARWVYKFILVIKSGDDFQWVEPLIATLGALAIGIWYPLYIGKAWMIPIFIFTAIAIIQFGYELLAKPLIKLANFLCKLFDYFVDKWEQKIGLLTSETAAAISSDTDTDTDTASTTADTDSK